MIIYFNYLLNIKYFLQNNFSIFFSSADADDAQRDGKHDVRQRHRPIVVHAGAALVPLQRRQGVAGSRSERPPAGVEGVQVSALN